MNELRELGVTATVCSDARHFAMLLGDAVYVPVHTSTQIEKQVAREACTGFACAASAQFAVALHDVALGLHEFIWGERLIVPAWERFFTVCYVLDRFAKRMGFEAR